MEEKKFDINSFIGFILMGLIFIYMLWQNQQGAEDLTEISKQEQVQEDKSTPNDSSSTLSLATTPTNESTAMDSEMEKLKKNYGDFAYAFSLPSAVEEFTLLENNVLSLKINNKGGYIEEARLKNFVNHDSLPIYLVKGGNSSFGINFTTIDNRVMNSSDLFFEPTLTQTGENQSLSMKLKVSETEYLEYLYELQPDEYMFNFSVSSNGLTPFVDFSKSLEIDWKLKTIRNSKSISYEGRYTDLHYAYEGEKKDYLGQGEDQEVVEDIDWIGYKQHFFSSILIPESAFKSVDMRSTNLVLDETIDTVFTKAYHSKIPVTVSSGEIKQKMRMYIGPTDFKTLQAYNENLDQIVPLGWGIFGWINRYLFIPLFGFLIGVMPYGFAIITMTILIKIVLSFVQYKQFLSQAKMKILKPELDAIGEKYKNNKMKAQQERLALQNKAGASPMSGCLPGLAQIPVFYALFMFFPSAFDLRQKQFLWADDLSAYDSVLDISFYIPFYGDHVSLFPILAALAIFVYMKLTTGQQMAQQPKQEGMPDMSKMMKYMIYFSPLMMLIFFNNYASGLSLYYFVSNLISIFLIIIIKNYIIDEQKVLAKIEINKRKPKKQNRFQRKMAEIMEQAEAQKQAQQKRKR